MTIHITRARKNRPIAGTAAAASQEHKYQQPISYPPDTKLVRLVRTRVCDVCVRVRVRMYSFCFAHDLLLNFNHS